MGDVVHGAGGQECAGLVGGLVQLAVGGQLVQAVRVLWDMPVWPVWQLTGWVVDPHYLVCLQTFRQRGRRGQPGLAR